MRPRIVTVIVPLLLGTAAVVAVRAQQSDDPKKAAADMAAMMEKAKRFTQPGERHKALERFLGKWNIETRIVMAGNAGQAEKGTAEFSWLMAGRWLKSEWKGSMMGMPMEGFMILGYDNFKQSYVSTMVTNLDTAMGHAEGDMDPSQSALLSYGTIDEYLTGEHDKMVKYVWRFLSKDRMVLEVHDLPIGEKNTMVVEVAYTRAP
jgi:hypothetical protein